MMKRKNVKFVERICRDFYHILFAVDSSSIVNSPNVVCLFVFVCLSVIYQVDKMLADNLLTAC